MIEHMFGTIDMHEVIEQSVQIATWVQAMVAEYEARAIHELLTTGPLWLRLTMAVSLIIGALESARRLFRRAGIRF